MYVSGFTYFASFILFLLSGGLMGYTGMGGSVREANIALIGVTCGLGV